MANNTPIKDWFKQCESLREQLAASQAREQQLLEAISKVLDVVDPSNHQHGCDCDPDVGYFCPACKWASDPVYLSAKQALSLPSDTSALESIIQKAGEVMRERCAVKADWYSSFVGERIRALHGVTLEDLKGGTA